MRHLPPIQKISPDYYASFLPPSKQPTSALRFAGHCRTELKRCPRRRCEREDAGSGLAITHFAARGGELVCLVYLVRLVYLVYLVQRTRETRQTRAPDKLPGVVVRCLSGQFNIHHSTLNFPIPTLPLHKAPTSCAYIPILFIEGLATHRVQIGVTADCLHSSLTFG